MFNLIGLGVVKVVDLDRFVADVAQKLFSFGFGLRNVVIEELLPRDELLIAGAPLLFETLEEFLVFFV